MVSKHFLISKLGNLSKILIDSIHNKGKLIQNLKGSVSQDKFRRVRIMSDTDHSMEREVAHSYIDKDDRFRESSFIYNANILKKKGKD